jgi:hypothetical protein
MHRIVIAGRTIATAIARADPAIHPLRRSFAKQMDARVKPAHDDP